MSKWSCWIDRKTRIVVRDKRAVHLGFVQFAVFDALHTVQARIAPSWQVGKKLTTRTLARRIFNANDIADLVYRGTKKPSTRNTIHVVVQQTNRKLAHIGLKIRGVNRKQNSFYQIVVLT